jgi:hypothetical protein
MTERVRKRAPAALRATQWGSEVQQANARTNAAREAKERHQRPRTVIDWPAAIARLEAMLNRIEDQ